MIQFLISAAFVLVFLFVFVLLASGMFWVASLARPRDKSNPYSH